MSIAKGLLGEQAEMLCETLPRGVTMFCFLPPGTNNSIQGVQNPDLTHHSQIPQFGLKSNTINFGEGTFSFKG